MGVTTPPISLLGCNTPEHEIYQIGFTFTGLLLSKSIYNWQQILYPQLFSHRGIIPKYAMIIGSYMPQINVAMTIESITQCEVSIANYNEVMSHINKDMALTKIITKAFEEEKK